MNVKLTTPQRAISVILNEQKVVINYPNVGQHIDIETTRAVLANGMYDTLATSRLKSTNLAARQIAACAFFTVCIPKLKELLRVDSLMQLQRDEMIEVVKVYEKEIMPWLEAWETYFRSFEDEEEVEEENENE